MLLRAVKKKKRVKLIADCKRLLFSEFIVGSGWWELATETGAAAWATALAAVLAAPSRAVFR
jgi:hypothetical protein